MIAGHRFVYGFEKKAPFLNVNKVEVKDEIIVYWQDKRYIYEVFKKYETPPDDTTILYNNSFDTLTIFTCTPLFNPINRLVIVGKIVRID